WLHRSFLEARMRARIAQIFQRQPGAGEILDRRADRFEQRDLVMIAPPGPAAARKIEKVAGDVVFGEHAGAHRLDDIAGFAERAGPRIDEDAGAPDAVVVHLAHLRPEAADEVEMDAERQPVSLDQRALAQSSAADD